MECSSHNIYTSGEAPSLIIINKLSVVMIHGVGMNIVIRAEPKATALIHSW